MSYEIVKGIKIDKEKKEVWIKSASNNVHPRTFTWWHATSLTVMLLRDGLVTVQKEILLQYFNGNFQKSNNNYERSLKLLDRKEFNWDTVGTNHDNTSKKYSETHVKEVLFENFQKYNNRKLQKCTLYNLDNYKFIKKRTSKYIYYANSQSEAKIFNSTEEARYYLGSTERNISVQLLEVA